ncbi:hypothetical protein CAI21_14750 [Alkalilimnicola ehrlichii]|uniref:Uncharacterized protein n=1 Tax=Alkalilimnicola ehrlichii TaxID=351052 RepID=A0A3E0WQY4_9GAMM|nr:hypothetical protein [Alkalilimnicola ehrlichii]RFA27298.1 hypothetical protein CAI21_14750 [Alkalilimnicola ehrlichii]RFA34407.1 hypothetical protein CAL65_15320 [Alkalilimnicola ehrlichii]
MTINGPLRLILIHSGVYDYAEIDLWRSGHLVAHNNAGKTSLIATLQFLYIDRQTKWSFSKSREETRRFYFTTDRSFVIFECMTSEGIKTVAIRGLGKMQGYDFERWVFDGEYRPEDFLDGKQIRDPKLIKAALAERNVRKLEPNEYRQVLTGVGNRRELPKLGIVPVREAKQYEHFIQLFGYLINLERMTQAEFKDLLIEVNRDEIPVPRIDLYRDYAGVYDKLRKRSESLRQFEAARPQVLTVLEDERRRQAVRGRVPLLWERYVDKYKEARGLLYERIAEREAELAAVGERIESLGGEITAQQGRLTEIGRQLGPVEKDLAGLAERRERFKHFVVELVKQELANMKSRALQLREQIAVGKREGAASVGRRLTQNERRLAESEKRLNQVSSTLASRLRQRFDDATLARVFTLANPDLLGQSVTDGALELHDEAALTARVEALAARIEAERYSDEVLSVSLTDLEAPDLARYSDPAIIREEIAELEQAVQRDREALEAAERREALEQEVAELEAGIDVEAEQLRQYEALQADLAQAPQWQEQLEGLREQEAAIKAAIEALEAQRNQAFAHRAELGAAVKEHEGRLTALNRRNQEIDQLCQRRREMFDWQPNGEGDLPETLESAEAALKQALLDEMQLTQNIHNGLRLLRESPYHEQFMGDFDDEAATLAALAERLEAAEAWRQSVQEDWQGLVKHISHEIKRLIDGLEALKRRVAQLNQQIGSTPISNLRELRVEINAERDRLVPLEVLAEQTAEQGMLSFGEGNTLSLLEAQERIGEILRQQAALSLTDLFTVSFWVVRQDGREDLYHQLEGVESNGTTITIKVVLFVLLLRGLFQSRQEVSLPFYLDEVSALDERNARRIVDLARSLNFVPILASPTEMDAAEVIYELRPGSNGRLVVGPEHRIEISREEVAEA